MNVKGVLRIIGSRSNLVWYSKIVPLIPVSSNPNITHDGWSRIKRGYFEFYRMGTTNSTIYQRISSLCEFSLILLYIFQSVSVMACYKKFRWYINFASVIIIFLLFLRWFNKMCKKGARRMHERGAHGVCTVKMGPKRLHKEGD